MNNKYIIEDIKCNKEKLITYILEFEQKNTDYELFQFAVDSGGGGFHLRYTLIWKLKESQNIL